MTPAPGFWDAAGAAQKLAGVAQAVRLQVQAWRPALHQRLQFLTSPNAPGAWDTHNQLAAGRKRPAWQRYLPALAIIAVTALLFLTREFWLPFIGDFLIVSDPLRPADAVVALSGGERERAASAAVLLNQGYAQWFVVTNWEYSLPGVRESYADLMRQEAIWQGVPPERILIAPGEVKTTYEEALAVRKLAQEMGWNALIVVTDPSHTRRAGMVFRDAFRDTNIVVTVRPVNEHWYRADSWWKSQDGLRETWTEYLKLFLYVAGYR